MNPINPVAGSVKIQAQMIRSTTVQFTPLSMAGTAANYAYFKTTCRMIFPVSRQRSITFSSNS
jgi:hypothetical protein